MFHEVARLDGFLSGLAAVSGGIRDYTAFSYLLNVVEDSESVEQAIKKHLEWYPELQIAHSRKLQRGIYELEDEIRRFLIRGAMFASESGVDRRKYLSYRVMEMIEAVVDGKQIHEVMVADSAQIEFCSEIVFFCVRFEKNMLVLQFNDDKEFKRGLLLGRSIRP